MLMNFVSGFRLELMHISLIICTRSSPWFSAVSAAAMVHRDLLSVVCDVFEKLENNRIVDHLEKSGLFPDLQFGFRSSRSSADLQAVASDRIARAFNRSEATRLVALDISKAFDRV